MNPLVLDTNIALDLFVFEDPATEPLRAALAGGHWIATAAMREELARVLGYPQIARRLDAQGRPALQVLDAFDQQDEQEQHQDLRQEHNHRPYTCKDADDQKFIDLAAAHRATLVSKDDAVLCMARRLSRVGVRVCKEWGAGHAP